MKSIIKVPRMNSRIQIIPSSEFSSPGESLTKVFIDEGRWMPSELFASIVPAVISSNGRIVITSTAGSPSGWFYELVKNPKKGTHVFWSDQVLNPYTSTKAMDFAHEQLKSLIPGLFQREFENRFAELGDEFLRAEAIDSCIDLNLENQESSENECFSFWDLSGRRDLTSRCVLEQTEDDDGNEVLRLINVFIMDPKKSFAGRTDFQAIRDRILLDRDNFDIVTLGLDTRSEAAELETWLVKKNIPYEGYTATAQSNMNLWGVLANKVNSGVLRIPNNQRLVSELRGLRVEEFSFGRSWRVVDSSSKLHRDVAMSLAGALWLCEQSERKPAQFDTVQWVRTNTPDYAQPGWLGSVWEDALKER